MTAKAFFQELLDQNYWGDLIWNDMLYLPKRRIIFVSCSKNASSKVKLELCRIENGKYPPEGKSPHNRRAMNFLSPLDLGYDEFYKRLLDPSVVKFTVLREPWSRFVSCYRSRVSEYLMEEYDNPSYARNEWLVNRQKIIKATTGKSTSEISAISENISLEQFLEFVTNQDDYSMDRHWYHQHKSVFFDYFPYDLVGVVENLAPAMMDLAKKVGATEYQFEEKRLNASRRSKGSQDVDQSLKDSFSRKFHRDFDIFKAAAEKYDL